MEEIPGVSLINRIFTSDSSSWPGGISPSNSIHAKQPWWVTRREQVTHVFPSSIQGGLRMWLEVTADPGADATELWVPVPVPPFLPARLIPFRKRDRPAQPSARAVERWNQSWPSLGCRDGFLFPLIIQGSPESGKMTSYPTLFPLPPCLSLPSFPSFLCIQRVGDTLTPWCVTTKDYVS